MGPRSGSSSSGADEVAQGEVSEEQSESCYQDYASRPYFPCRITAVLANRAECTDGCERQKEYTRDLMPENRKNMRERMENGTCAAVGGPQPAIFAGFFAGHAADHARYGSGFTGS